MTAKLLPQAKQQYFDTAGNLLSGGKVYTYVAGTTTNKTTWSDAAQTSANSNPVILDSRGEADIFWNGNYKISVTTAADAPVWTRDNISSVDTETLALLAASGGSALVGFIQAGTGAVARTAQAKMREQISVKDFGAVGDEATDDTTAIQAAITAVITSSGGDLYFPNGTYKITSKLVIPASAGWRIYGQSRGGTIIKQYTNNTRIFSLEGDLTNAWEISEINFRYNSAQASTQTQAIAIFMGTGAATANGFFNWQIRRCSFVNGFRSIAGDITNSPAVWGCKVSECVHDNTMSGGLFFASPTPSVGQPNITITNNTIGCAGVKEPAVTISAGDNVLCERLEFMSGSTANTDTVLYIEGSNVTVIGCKSEAFAFVASSTAKLWNFPNSKATLIGCSFNGFTGTSTPSLISATSAGKLTIDGLNVASSMSAGAAVAYQASDILSVANVTITGNATDDLRGTLGNVPVPRFNADKRQYDYTTTTGDASITLTSTSDLIQLFSTALTANRTCALPTTSLYENMEFTIYRVAGGAFLLTVTDGVSGNNFVFPANVLGSVTYKYRGAWRVISCSYRSTDTGWTVGSGTANKGTFAAYGGATMSAGYVQAEAQASNDAAKLACQRILALEVAIRAAGIISA